MDMATGKHAGKSIEEILVKQPDYALWYMGELPASKAGKELRRLEKLLDARPFATKCQGCSEKAARATGYWGSPTLYFWCTTCNPYMLGASQGKLRVIKTYRECLEHIDLTAGGGKAWRQDVVRQLLEAKGLKTPLTKKKLAAFF
jgi:hypothetical protein